MSGGHASPAVPFAPPQAYMSLAQLSAAGIVSAAEALALQNVAAQYRLRIPAYYARLIDRRAGDLCPIRLQALPNLAERDPILPAWAQALSQRAWGRPVPWLADAIGDVARLVAPRLTHRYKNRAILHCTSACALYCRFCFRKTHLAGMTDAMYSGPLAPALAYLQSHPQIHEVILTGGDPLSLSDTKLAALLHSLAQVRHLRIVRLHTRMLVTQPTRLTPKTVALLRQQPLQVVVVSHFNHPRECTALALRRLRALRRAGVMLYNQSVLLRRVNDHPTTLRRLFETLYAAGVAPYYLHHPDWTPGTFHFRPSIRRGRALMRVLRGRVSGPALPSYMLDLPGGLGKIDLEQQAAPSEKHADAALGGALYQFLAPSTRAGPAGAKVWYADLYPRGGRKAASYGGGEATA